MSKVEFGRHLQKILHDKNWTQSELARKVEEKTGSTIGRDAISTYINGRSFPTPASVNLLCKALDMTREELFPNSIINATNDEHPAFEMKVAPGHPGRAWVRLNRMMSFESATEIVRILGKEDRSGDEVTHSE